MPFKIMVKTYNKDIHHIVIDEGDYVSIISSFAWKSLTTLNLLAFNRRKIQPLGILPQFHVTFGGKTICIDVMVVIDSLNLNFLLG